MLPATRERHKSIAIPVTTIGNKQYMLIVHDRRYQEWTFVTGGCRRREVINPLRCALRELEEETRGMINLKKGNYSYFQFSTKYKGPGDSEADIEDDVTSIYHVYLIDFPMTTNEHTYIIRRFNEEKYKMENQQMYFRKNYDENDKVEFDTLDGITARENLWDMIRIHVISNPDFHEALSSQLKSPFYFKS
jgi:hypothetical protein